MFTENRDFLICFFLCLNRWVPFKGMKEILVQNHGLSPDRIHVVEEGLDTDRTFNPALFDHRLSRQRVYPTHVQNSHIFLSVFKWEKRKAYKELIKAFAFAFPAGENVTLFLRTNPPQDIGTVVKDILGHEDLRIQILSRQDDHRYQQMIAGADVFVLASHGEGWGRPLLDGKTIKGYYLHCSSCPMATDGLRFHSCHLNERLI